MKKNYLTVGLALSVMMVSFAQTKQIKEGHDKVMTSIEKMLNEENVDKESIGILNLKKVEGIQFFTQKEFLTEYGNFKKEENAFSSVLKQIKDGKTSFTIEDIVFSSLTADAKFVAKGDGTMNKKGEVKNKDKCAQYKTINEVFVKVQSDDDKKKNSEIKSEVTYTWLIEYDIDKENDIVDEAVDKAVEAANKQYENLEKSAKKAKVEAAKTKAEKEARENMVRILKDIKLTKVSPKEIAFLTTEKQDMKNVAETLIKEWYDALTIETLSKALAISDALSLDKTGDNVVVAFPNSKKISVKNVPVIKLNVEPYKYIAEGEEFLYTDPVAYYEVKPTFEIGINDDFKAGKIESVKYDTIFHKPETDAVIIERQEVNRETAKNIVNDFTNKIAIYAKDSNAESKDELLSLFADKNAVVEVSNMSENGKENVVRRKAFQYVSLLKQATISINAGELEFQDGSTMDRVELFVTQTFESESYSDTTEKKITLKKSSEEQGGGYLIEKIEVVPGSTKLIEK